MAYDSVKAVHIDIQIGGRSRPRNLPGVIDLAWAVARYLESQGVKNLFCAPQRRKAESILNHTIDHPELFRLTNRGQIEFFLNYPPIEQGWPAAYADHSVK